MGDLWGDLWAIMMTGQAFLAQCLIDEILIKIKMNSHSQKFKKLESPNEIKFCLKRKKLVLFSDRFIYQGTFFSISKVQVTFLFNYNYVSALRANLKTKDKNKTKQKKTCQNTSIKKVK